MVLDFDETKRSSANASRRWFLNRMLVFGSAGWVWPSLFTGCNIIPDNQQMSSAQTRNASDVMDEALGLLGRTGPEYRGGLANHGPMAAEALVTLGRLEAVVPWVERYKRNLQEPPTSRDAISADNWREALGQYRRVGDWIAFFDRQLKEKPWTSVLNEWLPRLAPGLVAAAAHGLIRTGHAARSLSLKDNPARRLELAHGLAYWAARYQVLPGSSEKSKGVLMPGQALKQVELLPAEGRRQGLISEELDRLATLPSFAKVAGLVDASGNAGLFLSDLTENFARVYVENARGIGSVIAFIHAVTGPSAIRLLLPYVKPEDTPNLLRFGWQAAAGLYAAYGARNATGADVEAKPKDPNKDDLIDRAVASDDEHAIKFTEACLREYSTNPKPVYLQAANRAVETLSGR